MTTVQVVVTIVEAVTVVIAAGVVYPIISWRLNPTIAHRASADAVSVAEGATKAG